MTDNGTDIYASDREEGPSSAEATITVVNPRKRPATARIHASRSGPPRAKRVKRTTVVGAPAASESAAGNWAQVKRINGECAPFNDKSNYIDDPINHRMFMFGGFTPSAADDDDDDNNNNNENDDSKSKSKSDDDDKGCPTSDFYCCDTITMRWTNLTDSLTFRTRLADPFADPFADTKTTLPLLVSPGCALVRIAGKSFIFIFGGYDCDAEEPTCSVIVVDPDALTWWYLNIEGQGVKPRIDPTAASVGNEVFIFGGHERFGGDCGPCGSYNVLRYIPDTGTWQWKIRDKLYSNLIPANHAFGAAIPVYHGKKILLLPGRYTDNNKFTFTPMNIFYYHIGHDTFQSATQDFVGNFPRDMSWYCVYEYCKPNTILPPPNSHPIHLNGSVSTSPSALHQASIASPNGKRLRGRPRKNQASQRIPPPVSVSASGLSVNGGSNSQNLYSLLTSPSVVICGWIEYRGYLAPELWHLFLGPEDKIVCLSMAQRIWDLKHDLQIFWCVEGQLRILGRDNGKGRGKGANRDVPRFDVYVDLPYQSL